MHTMFADQVMADPAIAPATAPVDALASLDTIVSEALAPVEPAAAMQEEGTLAVLACPHVWGAEDSAAWKILRRV